MNKLISHIISRGNYYFFGILAVMLALLSQMHNPGFDGSFETLGIQKNHYIEDSQAIDSIFQEDRKVFIEVIPKDTNLATIIADMDTFNFYLKQQFDTISFRSVIKLAPIFYGHKARKKVTIHKALAKFSKIKLFSDLVSKDKQSYLLVLGINKGNPKIIVESIEAAKKASHFQGIKKMNITSEFHIENAINEVLVHDVRKIIGSIFLAFLVIMILAYRHYFTIFYVMLIVTLTLLITFFVFLQFGIAFNLITLMVLPVVIVLSVADGIHLLTGMSHEKEGLPIATRIRNVYQKYFMPSLLTSITTAVAFLTLSFNHTKSVVHLGQITGISIILSFIVCYLLTPFVFKKWYKPSRNNTFFFTISSFFQQRKKVFTYLLLPLVILAIILLPKLQFKNNFEIFLPLGSSVKEQHDAIKDHYYSQIAMELTFRLQDTAAKQEIVRKITASIERIDGINVVRSRQSSAMVMGRFMLPIDLSKLSGYTRKFEADKGFVQRMQIRVADPNKIPLIEADIRQVLAQNELSEIRLTSPALIFSYVNKEVASSLIKSLLVSTLFLLLVFYFLTGSILRALIGMLANIVPLSVIVIIFVGFNLNINIVTAVTAVVCLGLIVDDTIHAFYRKVVLQENLEELGFGMLTTTIILVTGFGLFSMSSIQPIIIFGSVSAVVFVVTLICDFTLLLYLLDFVPKKDPKNQRRV